MEDQQQRTDCLSYHVFCFVVNRMNVYRSSLAGSVQFRLTCASILVIQSALHLAVTLGQTAIARALVECGADITALDSRGNTAVHLAKNGELARAVLRGAPADHVKGALRTFNDLGLNPLHVAAAQGRLDVALELVARHGADVEEQDRATGRTALHHSVRANSKAVCELLLEYEADANAQDHAGNTPLHAAVQYDLFAVTKLLVDFGADCVAANAYFQTPLDLAMHYGSTEASRAMLSFPSIRMPTKNLELVAQSAFPQLAPAVQPAPAVHTPPTAAPAPAPIPTISRIVHGQHLEPIRKSAEDKSADTARAVESGGMRNNSEGEWQMLDGDELNNTEGETEWHVHRNKKLTTGVDKLAKYVFPSRYLGFVWLFPVLDSLADHMQPALLAGTLTRSARPSSRSQSRRSCPHSALPHPPPPTRGPCAPPPRARLRYATLGVCHYCRICGVCPFCTRLSHTLAYRYNILPVCTYLQRFPFGLAIVIFRNIPCSKMENRGAK